MYNACIAVLNFRKPVYIYDCFGDISSDNKSHTPPPPAQPYA